MSEKRLMRDCGTNDTVSVRVDSMRLVPRQRGHGGGPEGGIGRAKKSN